MYERMCRAGSYENTGMRQLSRFLSAAERDKDISIKIMVHGKVSHNMDLVFQNTTLFRGSG